jgi:DNA invertase Pin-like site-specific DNA recombinase
MKLIAYYRVSTQRQGKSGLGLSAQREAVCRYAADHGQIVAEYVEIESGADSTRQQLAEAIRRTRTSRGRLVIATLDRLSRSVAFVATIMETKIDFVCADCPNAKPFELHIRATMAEEERRKISERTKAALTAAKARGVRLGTHRRGHHVDHAKGTRNGLAKAQAAADANRKQRWADAYTEVGPIIQSMREDDETLQAIADRLNAENRCTVTGKPFSPTIIMRILRVLPSIML